MRTQIFTFLLLNFLNVAFTFAQCDEEFIDKEAIADTTYLIKTKNYSGYIFPGNYHGFVMDKNEKTFTLNPTEVQQIENILTDQYNEVHKNDLRVYGYQEKRNTIRYLKKFDRQYLGFFNNKAEKSAMILLANRKGRKKRNFECFNKIMSFGLGEFYEKNQQLYVVNLRKQQLIIY